MERLVNKFTHRKGVHCGTSAVSDILNYKGIPYSEALCFGLGCGLGFYYIVMEDNSPSRFFHGRNPYLESNLCENLEIELIEFRELEKEKAWEMVKRRIDEDEPIILHTDLYFLPYYKTKTHFNGHRIVLVGYNEEKATAFVADTDKEGFLEISLNDLMNAWSSDAFPNFSKELIWWEIKVNNTIKPLYDSVKYAIINNAFKMINDRLGGTLAMYKMADDILMWKEKARDWRYCARFCYQIIEKRGTGGSLFRRLYANFLEEVQDIYPKVKEKKLKSMMDNIANKWTLFAFLLKEISEDKDKNFKEISKIAKQICNDEENFYKYILKDFF